jgi:hypothetical protein
VAPLLEAVEVAPFSGVTMSLDLEEMLAPEEEVAVREGTPLTDGLITSLDMELQTPVVVEAVVPETQTSSNTPSMGEATAQEMVVPVVPEP